MHVRVSTKHSEIRGFATQHSKGSPRSSKRAVQVRNPRFDRTICSFGRVTTPRPFFTRSTIVECGGIVQVPRVLRAELRQSWPGMPLTRSDEARVPWTGRAILAPIAIVPLHRTRVNDSGRHLRRLDVPSLCNVARALLPATVLTTCSTRSYVLTERSSNEQLRCASKLRDPNCLDRAWSRPPTILCSRER